MKVHAFFIFQTKTKELNTFEDYYAERKGGPKDHDDINVCHACKNTFVNGDIIHRRKSRFGAQYRHSGCAIFANVVDQHEAKKEIEQIVRRLLDDEVEEGERRMIETRKKYQLSYAKVMCYAVLSCLTLECFSLLGSLPFFLKS